MGLFAINWLAVFAAAVCGFIVGGIWYGPVMGKKWMGAVGRPKNKSKIPIWG